MITISRVKFSRGTEANILKLNSNKTAVDGTVYISTDTNHMWVGTASGTLNQIIDGIDHNTTYGVATQSANGLMSSADKKALDNVPSTYATKSSIPSVSNATITIKQTGKTDQTFTLNGGATTISLNDNNTTYGVFSGSANGLTPSTVSGNLSTTDVTTSQYVLTSDGKWHTLPDNAWNNSTYTLSSLGGITPAQVDTKIATAVSAAYKYKGSVTSDKLPTTGQVTGDVYNITNDSSYGKAGMNVAWNGSAWDALGSNVDLSNYVTTSDSRLTNSRPANGGNSTTVNGHTVNSDVPANAKFTDTNTWRGITDSYSGTATNTSLSQKGANSLYNALVNGYANSAGSASSATKATQDSDGNQINTTYLKLSGGTMTGAIKTGKNGGAWSSGMTQGNSMLQWTSVGVRDGTRYDPIMWGKDTGDNIWNFGWSATGGIGFFGFKKGRTDDGTDGSLIFDPATGVTSGSFSGSLRGNASSASSVPWSGVSGRPTGNLQNISTNGSTSNFLRGDGTWVTPSYPSVSNSTITIKQAGRTDQTFTLNGGATTINLNDSNTWTAMKGATTSAAGTAGYVPAPAAGAATRYLRSDGTWSVPPDNDTHKTWGLSISGHTVSIVDGGTTKSVTVPDNDTTALTSMTGTLGLNHGGTGATTASGARANIGAVSSDVITISSTQPTSSECKLWIQV